jgi:hypothetical protein
MNKDSVISQVYYDVKGGYGSIDKTWQAARKIDPKITKAQVKAFLDKQEVRQGKKRRGDNSYVAFAPREEYQIDLADFSKEGAYRYAFVCIDVFSKMLFVAPMKDKTPKTCAEALDKAMEKMHVPSYVYTDDGGEFKAAFDERLKYYLIEHIVTRGHDPFAERAIRTLREGIDARLKATDKGKSFWWFMLDPVVKQYNDAKQSTTGEAPNDIHHLNWEEDKDWIEELRGRITGKAHFNRNYPQIAVGDKVKSLQKPGKYGEFKTGFVNWSAKTYTVTNVEYQNGYPMFHLEGYHRPLRNHEVLKVTDVQKPPDVQRAAAETPTFEGEDNA